MIICMVPYLRVCMILELVYHCMYGSSAACMYDMLLAYIIVCVIHRLHVCLTLCLQVWLYVRFLGCVYA